MKKLTIIILFLSVFTGYTQTAKLEGVIKDSIGNPLELANVIAFKKGTSKIESYSITNDKGIYKLHLSPNQSYDLRVSYIGFITLNDEIEVADNTDDLTKDFTLYPEKNTLDDVEITFEMPVTIKGDTIVYNSDSFSNGTERKLGDVLKKLPGVEINDNGEIEVEGKTVSKVMVEGKDFFDGDSKVASQNIPADAVDKIEVLRNYNEIGPIRGVGDDSDNIALNIKLKEGKKNFWFGEVTAGAGTNDGYLVHPKLFYYSPKTSINIITDVNNIGEVPFTRQDYYRFTGGFRNLMNKGGTSFNVGDNSLGFALTQNNMAREIDTKFGAFNFTYSPKKSLTISGFSIFNDSEIDMLTESKIENIVTGTLEDRTNLTRQKTQLGLLKLSANYVPDNDTYFDYNLFLKLSKQTEREVIDSKVNTIEENILNGQEDKPTSINQDLSYYKVLDDKNIVSFELQHLYMNESPFINFLRDNQPFEDIIPTEPQDIYDLNQEKDIVTNKLDAKVDYYYILNKKSNLNLTLGTLLSKQNFDSSIYQILENNEELEFENEELVNDVTYNFSDFFLGIHYKAIAGRFTFTPGITLHNYVTKDIQLGTENTNNDVNLTPDLSIMYKIKQSETLRFNYTMTRAYTDVNKLAEAYVLNNFNALYAGNRYLESAMYNTLRLDYFSFSMFNFTNMNASLSYSKRKDVIKSESDFTGENQTISSPFNSNLPDETLNGLFRYGRRFGKFKINAKVNLNYSKSNGIVQGLPDVSESFTHNYEFSFGTNFKTAPNLELGYNKTFNEYNSSTTSNKFTTDRPFAKLDVIFLKDFSFIVDYSYYNYKNDENTIKNSYAFLDASLYYQKTDSNWEFILSGNNLTNNQSINTDNFIPNYSTSTSQYLVMERRFMFTVKYNL